VLALSSLESFISYAHNILLYLFVLFSWDSLILSKWERWRISSCCTECTHLSTALWENDWKCFRRCKSILPNILWAIYPGWMHLDSNLLQTYIERLREDTRCIHQHSGVHTNHNGMHFTHSYCFLLLYELFIWEDF
jgi:hypothetical protein